MSRIGKLPVALDSKVTLDYQGNLLKVKGPNGELELKTVEGIDLEIEKEQLRVLADFSGNARAMAGTTRALIANMVHGVTEGFSKVLNLVGVGYRAQLSGQKLTLSLGFSHPIVFELPKVITANVEGTKLTLTSCNKQVLGQVVADIRKYRPPEPYKGKGILFEGEIIRRKAGKAGKGSK